MTVFDPTTSASTAPTPYDATIDTDARRDGNSFNPDVSAPNPATSLALPPSLVAVIATYAKLVNIAREAERRLAGNQAEYLSVIQREAELSRLQDSAATAINAWCADYTEELTGTVATLEVPGEINPTIGGGINIAPGYSAYGSAQWSSSYGKMQFGPALSPEGFAWNLTMLMPWVKWMPIWRYATVTAKDVNANTLDVNLLPIISKASSYLAHETTFNDPWDSSMSGVEVRYMSCGAGVFDMGDEVIVKFEGGGGGGLEYYTPYVIGFRQEPKECWPEIILSLVAAQDSWVLPAGGGEPWADITTLEPPGPPTCYSSEPSYGGAYPEGTIYQNVYVTTGAYRRNPEMKPDTDAAYWVYPYDDEPAKISSNYKKTWYSSGGAFGFDYTNVVFYSMNTTSNPSGVLLNEIKYPLPYYQGKLCCNGPPPDNPYECWYEWPDSAAGAWVCNFIGTGITESILVPLTSPTNTFTVKNIKDPSASKIYQFDRFEFRVYPPGYDDDRDDEWVAVYVPTAD